MQLLYSCAFVTDKQLQHSFWNTCIIIFSPLFILLLQGYELILSDDHHEVVQRGDGGQIPYRIRYMGIYLVIETTNGLILLWDKKTSIFIKLSPNFKVRHSLQTLLPSTTGTLIFLLHFVFKSTLPGIKAPELIWLPLNDLPSCNCKQPAESLNAAWRPNIHWGPNCMELLPHRGSSSTCRLTVIL